MAGPTGVSVGTQVVRRSGSGGPLRKVEADICVVGAGIAGVSAAIEAARLGRKVVLIDGLPALGGQAVNSIIGTFCGLFSNGTHGYQFTRGIADDILDTLGKNNEQLYYRNGPLTTVVYYDEIALGRSLPQGKNVPALRAELQLKALPRARKLAFFGDVVRSLERTAPANRRRYEGTDQ